MDQTLKQVGELLLGSIPTIIFLTLLYGIYTVLVHRPLTRVLTERRSKTEGAIEKARADIAAAEARTAEYEQRLREARLALFKSQEARRQQALQARSAAVAEARKKAQAQVEQARAAIEKEKVAAQTGLQAESTRLAAEIIRSVLQPAMAGGEQ
jgi:F-type H+-transporting ATPase subunit b